MSEDPGIGRYEPLWGAWYLDNQIGEGGFGKVYRVRKRLPDREYYSAVKHIRISKEIDAQPIIREINLMSRLRGHSNIVSFEDVAIIDDREAEKCDILIRMELLSPLREYMAYNLFSEADIVALGIDICCALELCERLGIIHGDIKPGNILVSEFGSYKLGDFGSAYLFESNSAMLKRGTYAYMAPEVYRGEKPCYSSDVYSLGIVLYILLAGGLSPFMQLSEKSASSGEIEVARMRRLCGEPVPPIAGVNSALNEIIQKAAAPETALRYNSPADLKKDLEQYAANKQRISAVYPQEPYPSDIFAENETMLIDEYLSGAGKPFEPERSVYIAGERPYSAPEIFEISFQKKGRNRRIKA